MHILIRAVALLIVNLVAAAAMTTSQQAYAQSAFDLGYEQGRDDKRNGNPQNNN